NAGFSRCNPQRLFLPVIIDPEYHFEAINVEAQQNNPNSLLWWMKRLIALRKRFQAFGRGTLDFLQPENRKILAFPRSYEAECCPSTSHHAAGSGARRAGSRVSPSRKFSLSRITKGEKRARRRGPTSPWSGPSSARGPAKRMCCPSPSPPASRHCTCVNRCRM